MTLSQNDFFFAIFGLDYLEDTHTHTHTKDMHQFVVQAGKLNE